MAFDWEKIQQSKQHKRRELAARSVAEKLKMLDDLRERSLALRASTKVLSSEKSLHNHQ